MKEARKWRRNEHLRCPHHMLCCVLKLIIKHGKASVTSLFHSPLLKVTWWIISNSAGPNLNGPEIQITSQSYCSRIHDNEIDRFQMNDDNRSLFALFSSFCNKMKSLHDRSCVSSSLYLPSRQGGKTMHESIGKIKMTANWNLKSRSITQNLV